MAGIAAGAIAIGVGAIVIGAGADGTGVGAAGIGAGVAAIGAAVTGEALQRLVNIGNSGDCVCGPCAFRRCLATGFRRIAIRFLIKPILIVIAALAPLPAFAYSCAMSPAKDAVIIKTDNAGDRGVTCKVDCTFKAAEGSVTISCSQQIPAGAKGWYVCLRPTGGKTLEFVSGSESCK
jgi:hypothetical protein